VGWLVGSYLQVVARTRAIMFLEILKVTLIVGSMFALSPLGPLWTAAGVGIGYGLNALTYLWSLRSEGVTVWSVLGPLLGPLVACVPMAASVFGVRYGLSTTHIPMGIRLLVEIVVGGVAYVPSAFLCAPKTSKDLIELLKKTLGRRRGAASV
jgi:lipopolysaccharide exporter